jgi:peptide/nickel transport system substrate-binding protein
LHVEDPAFDEIMGKLDAESDPEKRLELLGEAQRRIAENAVNGFLFQLAKIGIWDADLEGLWSNAPVQANDMTKVRWKS